MTHAPDREDRMKTLVAEDDFSNRIVLQTMLSPFGEVHIAVNGREALDAFKAAHEQGKPYELVCLDIMMPEMDGQAVLRNMRAFEEKHGVHRSSRCKIVMATVLGDQESVAEAVGGECDAYILKPFDTKTFLDRLREIGLRV